ncbi:DUF2304 domain-containing protein [uncultured Clostridium sp.]|uniref:DUF2304 domain-containing protein n=1 Tax=uncultured Clostridium sp. TaxID=59620 RepID=UPI0025CD77B9|nr:DUF2304 domain-containing protein [uncultured Clostridium sp.]
MSNFLRITLIVVSILTFLYIARKLKKSQLQVMDAFFWIVFSFVLMVIGVFPGIAIFLAEIVGIQSPVNFVYLVVIFLLLLRTFMLTIRVSFLEEKVKNLVEEIAIRENEK